MHDLHILTMLLKNMIKVFMSIFWFSSILKCWTKVIPNSIFFLKWALCNQNHIIWITSSSCLSLKISHLLILFPFFSNSYESLDLINLLEFSYYYFGYVASESVGENYPKGNLSHFSVSLFPVLNLVKKTNLVTNLYLFTGNMNKQD